jgi:uncharacterized RDD family membrane protein YckC
MNAAIITTNLASPWKRLGAALIDGLAAMIIFVPIMSISGVLQQSFNGQPMTLGQQIALFVGGWIVFLVLNGYLLYHKGQTIGKAVTKIRIADQNGNIPSFGKLIGLRYFVPGLVAQIPLVGGLLSLVDALFIFGQEHRCLHDHLAGTWVINE